MKRTAIVTGGSRGIGLAIAKQLAEQMDGMIWVESVYGKGSSFFVQLPMKKVSDGKISNVEWKETDDGGDP